MKVTIIGAGMMGRGIGTRAAAGGNDVELIDASVEDARTLAEELAGFERGGATASEGRIDGELVIFALPYQVRGDVAKQYADQLAGRVVVDITNPVDFQTMDRLLTPPDLSAAEELARQLGDRTPVVKAFNTTFAATLIDGEIDGQRLDVLIASDDEDAKRAVFRLVEDGGLRPIDCGPLRRARQLEQLGFLHMSLQDRLDWGWRSAVKFLR